MPITLERIPHQTQVAIRGFQLAGFTHQRIKKMLDVSLDVVRYIARQNPSNTEEVDAFKKGLIAESYGIARRSAIRVTDEKLDNCSAPQLAMVSGIFIDKARDIEGLNKPQFNIVNIVNDCKQTRDKLEKEMQFIDAQIASRGNVI